MLRTSHVDVLELHVVDDEGELAGGRALDEELDINLALVLGLEDNLGEAVLVDRTDAAAWPSNVVSSSR
ncbi:MAG: hypothetical protein U5Q44_04830 [Dehalococcoidia bacterium]|nr:hypothetical protein [Dehalococcoidia bacterium]